jgi:dihydrofolate reductase
MKAIVVVDKNWGIGKDGNLLVHLPGDLKYYKEKTTGNTIVLGRKTLSTFPGGKALPNRKNIVITRNPDFTQEDCVVCHSIDEVMNYLADGGAQGEVFIAGGAQVYEEFFDRCDSFLVTKIDQAYDADRFFPNLDEKGFRVVWQSEKQEEKGVTYRFYEYVR